MVFWEGECRLADRGDPLFDAVADVYGRVAGPERILDAERRVLAFLDGVGEDV